jgi:hypothetical protein
MPWPSSSLRMSSLVLNKLKYAIAAAFGLSLAASAAAAQDNGACGQFDWPVRREQALFSAPDLKTAESGSNAGSLAGGAIALELKPHADAAYVMPPARQPKTAGSYGSVIGATVPKAGTYQVTASAEAWIDVIQNGKAVASIAHTGKRDCPGIRKSVRFILEPGAVTIQISGATSASIKLALLPAE